MEFANLTWAIYVPRLLIGSSEEVFWLGSSSSSRKEKLRQRETKCLTLANTEVSTARKTKRLRLIQTLLAEGVDLLWIAEKIFDHLVGGELTTSSTEIAFLFLRKLITKSTRGGCVQDIFFGCQAFLRASETHNVYVAFNN